MSNFDFLDWYGQLTYWRMGECYNNFFVVPYEYRNRDGDREFGVKIYEPNGSELNSWVGFGSIEEAIEYGRSDAQEVFEEICQISQQPDQNYSSLAKRIASSNGKA